MANTQLVNDRIAFFVSQGLTGAALFNALKSDPGLPAFLVESEVAAITGLTPAALRQRRARRQNPPFTSLSRKAVRYERASFFAWLAARAAESEAR
jgi:predicted DNA-binding transcriptional regulator AlpA